MPGMRGGVPLTLEAPVSPALLDSSALIQALLHSWDPHMRPISVKAPCRDNRGPLAHGVGLFFSGGVDSFYSLVTHTEELTHLVTINGLDGIHDRRLIAMAQEVAKDQGLRLVIVTTDARNAVRGLAWQEYGHGAVLASCGLLLQNEMRKIYIASSKDPAHLEPAGTHPDLDPLWGTERLEFRHDTLVSRLEKISHIAHSPTAMKHLRV